jgi:hypothetical protein
MNKEFSEAEKIFEETGKKELPYSVSNAIYFRPQTPEDHSEPLKFEGKVVSVRAGHALIETKVLQLIDCPLSRCKRLWMEPGLRIIFERLLCDPADC